MRLLATLAFLLILAGCGGDTIVEPPTTAADVGIGHEKTQAQGIADPLPNLTTDEARQALAPLGTDMSTLGETAFSVELASGAHVIVRLFDTPDSAAAFADDVAAGEGDVTTMGEPVVYRNVVVTWQEPPGRLRHRRGPGGARSVSRREGLAKANPSPAHAVRPDGRRYRYRPVVVAPGGGA